MISRVFFHLFPVAVAGIAMIMDIRTAKVDNGWIIFSMSVGLFVCIWQKNITGIGFFIMGSVMPLFLMILFAFGLTGAGISAALLIFNHNFCERILYFIEYVKCTVGTGKISSYRRKNIAAPENFHFTIPVFISVLLYAGGIY